MKSTQVQIEWQATMHPGGEVFYGIFYSSVVTADF
jgi:hypothetical protein